MKKEINLNFTQTKNTERYRGIKTRSKYPPFKDEFDRWWKHCPECGQDKLIQDFYLDTKGSVKLRCKECTKIFKKDRRNAIQKMRGCKIEKKAKEQYVEPIDKTGYKQCVGQEGQEGCGRWYLPTKDNFYEHTQTHDRLTSRCKKCINDGLYGYSGYDNFKSSYFQQQRISFKRISKSQRG